MHTGYSMLCKTADRPTSQSSPYAPLFSRTPNLRDGNSEEMRSRLRQYFLDTFTKYESLFDCLASDQAFYTKSISLRHPLIFYYGHTATFFINKLLLTRMISERINQRFESMFAVGVDEMSWDDLNDGNYQWPTPAEVKTYRDQVRKQVLELIDNAPLQMPIDWNNPWWAIIMGIEHERIHLETSSVLIRQHKLAFVRNSQDWVPNRITGTAPQNSLITVNAGRVHLAKEKSAPFYGWDNEYGVHSAEVPAFEAAKYLVSNQEFLQFVEAGGYLNSHNWEEEGKGWLAFTKAQYPTFWIKKTNGWYLRLMTEEIPMPWDWPAEVNYHEAKAFCNWKKSETGMAVRLPTEDEWYRLYATAGLSDVCDQAAHANLHLDHGASALSLIHI